MKTIFTTLFSALLLITSFSFNSSAGIIFLSPTGGGNHSGSSWDNAFELTDRTGVIGAPGDSIWAMAGTYDAGNSFSISVNCSMFGGFSGTETRFNQRNPAVNITLFQNFITIGVFQSFDLSFDGFSCKNAPFVNLISSHVSNCVFDNAFVQMGDGNVTYDPTTFTDCIFKNLSPSWSHSAVENSVGGVILTRCLFKDNTMTNGFGGAFYCQPDFGLVEAQLYDCTFDHNNVGSGGVVYLRSVGQIQIADCLFTNNSGNVVSVETDSSETYNIFSNTFTGNTGTVITFQWKAQIFLEFMNNIVWGNTVSQNWLLPFSEDGQILNGSFAYNILQNDISSNTNITAVNNIIADPVLNPDYTLSSCSPAINAGVHTIKINTFDPVDATAGQTADLAGNSRIFGTNPDMGCYEYQSANYVSGGSHIFCSNNSPTNLFGYVNGTPDTLGIWSGPSALAGGYRGTFNPSKMTAGTYTYSLTGGTAPCTSVPVVVTVVQVANAGRDTAVNACQGTPIDLFTALGGNPSTNGTWSGPFNLDNGYQGTFDTYEPTGNYIFTYSVPGNSPCGSSSATVKVTINKQPSPGSSNGTVICSNIGLVNLFSYLQDIPDTVGVWSGPSSLTGSYQGTLDPSSISGGTYTYTYTVTGIPPCYTNFATVTVTIVTAPNAGIGRSIAVCHNSSPINLIDSLGGNPQSGGFWLGESTLTNGSLGTFNPATMEPGTYFYHVNGSEFCTSAQASVTVTINPAPATPTISTNGPTSFCTGGGVLLSSSIPSGNIWSTGETTQSITVSTTGSYTVSQSNSFGCISTSAPQTVIVNTFPAIPVITANGPTTFCFPKSVTLTSSAASGYLWSNGATTQSITVTSTGNYNVTVSNASGCKTNSTPTIVTVNQVVTNPVISTNGPTSFCSGLNVVLTSSSLFNNTWSTGDTTNSITVASTGNYAVTVSDDSGCKAYSVTTGVIVNPLPTVGTYTLPSADVCKGSDVSLNGTGAAAYTWSDGIRNGLDFVPLAAGVYYVTGTSSQGCTGTSSISINIIPTPTVGFTISPAADICAGSDITLGVTGNVVNAFWSDDYGDFIQNGQPFAPPATEFVYVAGIGANGCEHDTLALITVHDLPVVGVTVSPNDSICAGTPVTLSGTGAVSYTWNNGITDGQSFIPLSSQAYTVTGRDSFGCVNTANQTITVNPLQTIIPQASKTAICIGDSSNLSVDAPGNTIEWYDAQSNLLGTSASGDNFTVHPSNTSTYYAVASPNGPQTQVYHIGLNDLFALPETCNNNDYYGCDGYGGFQWQDNSAGRVSSVHVDFVAGVDCNGFESEHTAYLNDNFVNSFFTNFFPQTDCSCAAPGHQLFSIDISPDSYVTGGFNYFSINSDNCFGLSRNFNLGADFAVVTVVSANDCPSALTPVTVNVNAGQTWYLDADNDGHYISSVQSCSNPGAGYNTTATILGDCNDNDPTVWRSTTLYIDNDGDGYDNGQTIVCYGATIPAGYSATTLGPDCNDNNASTHATQTWYLDADNDGHYVSSVQSCSSPGAGYNTTATILGDCNDNDPTVWRSATLYIDNDGDGYDNGQTTICYGATIPAGYSATTLGPDCNDNNASIHAMQTWYLDADNDGHYVSSVQSCSSPGAGYNTTATILGDCNDNDPAVWRSATLYIDNDGDGYDNGQTTVCYGATIPAGYSAITLGHDCNDNNPSIHAVPAAPGSVTGPVGGCKGQTGIAFTITAVQGASSYKWTLPAGVTGALTSNSINVSFTNSYAGGNICVQAANSCGAGASSCKSIIVYTTKPSVPTAITGSQVVCAGSTQTYSTSPVANATSYTWTTPANATIMSGQGTASVSVKFNSSFSSGTLNVAASNCIGTSGARSLSIKVSAAPSKPGAITGPQTGICNSVYQYSIEPVSNATSYSWTIPPGCSINGAQNSNTISLNVPLNFKGGSVCIASLNMCNSSSPSSCVTLSPVPVTPSAISGPSSVCKNKTGVVFSVSNSSGTIFNWTVPTGCTITNGQGTSAITVNWGTVKGNVSVAATNVCGVPCTSVKTKAVSISTSGCGNTREEEDVADVSDNGNTITADDGITVWPNPVNEVLFVNIKLEEQAPIGLMVVNTMGQIVYQQAVSLEEGNYQSRLNVSQLPTGMYFIRITKGEKVFNEKIIIAR